MFEMANDLENVCIDLTRVENLLNILLDGVFQPYCEINERVQQYETVAELALSIVHKQEKEARRISDMLYEIDKQVKGA